MDSIKRLVVIPTMSTDGCVSDTPTKLDRALSYFFVAHADQCYCSETVYSLPNIVQEAGTNPDAFVQLLETALRQYLTDMFDRSQVSVSLDPNTNNQLGGTCAVILDIQVVDDNYNHNFPSLLMMERGKFVKLAALNNG